MEITNKEEKRIIIELFHEQEDNDKEFKEEEPAKKKSKGEEEDGDSRRWSSRNRARPNYAEEPFKNLDFGRKVNPNKKPKRKPSVKKTITTDGGKKDDTLSTTNGSSTAFLKKDTPTTDGGKKDDNGSSKASRPGCAARHQAADENEEKRIIIELFQEQEEDNNKEFKEEEPAKKKSKGEEEDSRRWSSRNRARPNYAEDPFKNLDFGRKVDPNKKPKRKPFVKKTTTTDGGKKDDTLSTTNGSSAAFLKKDTPTTDGGKKDDNGSSKASRPRCAARHQVAYENEQPKTSVNKRKTTTRASKFDLKKRRQSLAESFWTGGVRKSNRIKRRPLEYWKGERLLYGRVHNSLPTIIGVKYISPAKEKGKPGCFKVESFVSDNYKDLVDLASLH